MNTYLATVVDHFEKCSDEIFTTLVQKGQQTDITWGQLEVDCRKTIEALDTAVNEKGVVLIFLPHGKELFGSFMGCMLGGYTPSFMPCLSAKQDPELYWKSHQELISTIAPVGLLTDSNTAKQIESAGLDLGDCKLLTIENISLFTGEKVSYPNRHSSDTAFLQHSSGTTGLKKGVMLSFDAITKHSISYGKALSLRPDDVIVSWLPLYHDMGLIACFITPAFHNIKTVQISAFEWLSRPQTLFKLIDQHKATLCWMPNFAYEHMSNTLAKHAARFKLDTMRAFISCSEPCKAPTMIRFNSIFEKSGLKKSVMQNCYAMAETVFGVTQTKLGECTSTIMVNPEKLNTGSEIELSKSLENGMELTHCGQPIDGIQISIVDSNNNVLPDDFVGEISIEGDFLFDGYNKDKSRTEAVKPKDTYFSKDLGFIHNNNLYVLGRTDDLIIINGRNLYAHQVEAITSRVSGLKAGRVVAFSIFDESVGSDILAVMAETVTCPESNKQELHSDIVRVVQAELNIVPNIIELVAQGTLIKTSSGKMSRKENKTRFIASTNNQFKQAS